MVQPKQRTPWVRALAPEFLPHKFRLAAAGLTLGLDAWFTALRPWPLKVVIDRVIGEKYSRVPFVGHWVNDASHDRLIVLAFACLATLLIATGTGACTYLYTKLMGSVSERVLYSLRMRLFTHLQQLSLRFHNKRRVGDLMTRLTSDISAIRMLIARGLMQFLSNMMLVIAMLTMMFWLNWQFAMIAVSVTPFLFAAIWWHTNKIKDESRSVRESDGMLASLARESLSMIQTVKGFGQESTLERRFDALGQRSLRHYTARLRHQSRMAPIVDILAAVGLVLVMWFGAVGVIHGNLTTGDMIVFFAYVTSFYSPMRAMSRQASIFTKAAVGAERVAEILLSEPEVYDRPGAFPAPRLKGNISFEAVTFDHAAGQPVLRDFSLQIRKGERIAILGPTGAGKSTIAALLLKLYEPQKGRILLDGVDIQDLTADSIRRQIGLVLQDPILFHGTIRDNVTFGRAEASERDLAEACRIAGAQEFIERMPSRLETLVAEGGNSLSGGQRQRIAIARAVIRRAPILLLDEPTSSLDANSEADLIRSLDDAADGRTMILITHRPGPLRLVDRVIVLENGSIVKTCTPDDALLHFEHFNGESKNLSHRHNEGIKDGFAKPTDLMPGGVGHGLGG